MKHEFEKCNSCTVFNGTSYVEGDGYDIFNKQEKYIESGLTPDYEKDLYIRPGYGALCFCCGKINNLKKVMSEALKYENFYDFPGKIKEGYKFVIGPGVTLKTTNGIELFDDYAVYCTNYLEILSNSKSK